ncbi:sporulation delaying protein family toxin [Bacillus safensis]|uniref:sporulation delaying protein family toxin n=1 Tax=Bacillus safensis TaxID=561879 RepID=UPI003822EBA2
MKRKLFKRRITLIILLSLLVSSILGSIHSIEAIGQSHKYSGEEIYAGLAFGQGEVAKMFPEIWGKKTLEKLATKESKDKAQKLLKEMKEVEPNYFNKLEKAVYSKNFHDLSSLLQYSGEILKKIDPNITENVKIDSVEGACVTFVTWTAVAAIWVAVVAGAVVAAPVAEMNESNTLSNEILVKNMVERLN